MVFEVRREVTSGREQKERPGIDFVSAYYVNYIKLSVYDMFDMLLK